VDASVPLPVKREKRKLTALRSQGQIGKERKGGEEKRKKLVINLRHSKKGWREKKRREADVFLPQTTPTTASLS